MSEQTPRRRLARGEYDRMWRVLDMSLSAHSLLRDRFRRRQMSLTLTAMALSIIATSLAFLAGDHRLSTIDIFSVPADVLIGVLTVIIFFLLLIDVAVDWRVRTWEHREAVNQLAKLKARFRSATVVGDTVDTGDIELQLEYETVMAAVAEIPERQFLALKAKHNRKVELSKLIDNHRGAPVLYLRLLVVWKGLTSGGAADAGHTVPESTEDPPA